jgi:hypothetical protein
MGKEYKCHLNKKAEIIMKADELDKKQLLCATEIDLKYCLKQRLAQMLSEEQLKWYPRNRSTNLLYGDCNTKYFQLVKNGKHIRMWIFQLNQEERLIEVGENIKHYNTNYYKGLFGPYEKNNFTMVGEIRDDIPQVSHEENYILDACFIEEVKKATFQIEHNKPPA